MTIKACALIMKRRFEQWWWTIPPISRTNVRTSNLKIFDKTSGRHLCILILIFSESTLIVLFWIEWLQFLFTFTNKLFLLLLCFLITECDQGTFGEECKSRCYCLNGEGCNNVNGECPSGHCDAGWKTNTCSEGKEFLLSY